MQVEAVGAALSRPAHGMRLKELLREDLILPELYATTKDDVLRELGEFAGPRCGQESERLCRILREREVLGSTGIEGGVAIPHGKLPGLLDPVVCFARSKRGVPFDAKDSKPSHLFIVIFAPENDAGKHLKVLARISRLFKNPELRNRLMEAPGSQEIAKILFEEDAKL